MKNQKYVIKGGKLVLSEGVVNADVLIKDGLVESIGKDPLVSSDYTVIDASGKYVLPGLIDAHVHPQGEDNLQDLSESAGFGGITTLIHYVYVQEGSTVDERIEQAVEEGSRGSHLDFAFHVALQDTEHQIPQIQKAIQLGVTSFKMFMPSINRRVSTPDKVLIAAMDEIGDRGGLAMIHAENSACEYFEQKFVNQGKTSVSFFPQSRPNIVEADAVSRAIILANLVNCPLYLVHLSARESLEIVSKARFAGQVFYTETCPHYLSLTDDIFERFGSLAACAPPIRKNMDLEAMWVGVRNHLIDVIASDHGGVTRKQKEFDNVFASRLGIPGTETLLPLLHEEGINKGKIDFPKLVKVCCENPAKIFGLYPRKGTLQVGADADLVIFDQNELHVIEARKQHGKSDFTLYEGWRCHGKPILTMQRGKIVLEAGILNNTPGDGFFLHRKISKMPIL